MNSRKNEILRIIEKHPEGLTAHAIADLLKMDRSNVSRYLNELYKQMDGHILEQCTIKGTYDN